MQKTASPYRTQSRGARSAAYTPVRMGATATRSCAGQSIAATPTLDKLRASVRGQTHETQTTVVQTPVGRSRTRQSARIGKLLGCFL